MPMAWATTVQKPGTRAVQRAGPASHHAAAIGSGGHHREGLRPRGEAEPVADSQPAGQLMGPWGTADSPQTIPATARARAGLDTVTPAGKVKWRWFWGKAVTRLTTSRVTAACFEHRAALPVDMGPPGMMPPGLALLGLAGGWRWSWSPPGCRSRPPWSRHRRPPR